MKVGGGRWIGRAKKGEKMWVIAAAAAINNISQLRFGLRRMEYFWIAKEG